MALLTLFMCFFISLLALASAGTALVRFKKSGLPAAAASLIGLVLCWAAPVAVIGVAERAFVTWSGRSTVLAVTGFIGAACVAFGAYSAFRRDPRTRRGHCGQCGYDMRAASEASRCPECGSANAGNVPA